MVLSSHLAGGKGSTVIGQHRFDVILQRLIKITRRQRILGHYRTRANAQHYRPYTNTENTFILRI
jgi:hypothetical protein